MRPTRSWLLVGSCALVWLGGCVTVPEFRAVQRDVESLKQGKEGAASARLADMGVEVTSLHEEIASLRGELEDVRHLAQSALDEARASRELAERAGGSSDGERGAAQRGSAPTASDEVRSYEEAFRRYRAGEHRAALDRFQGFLQTHPSSDYADNALFWMGECHFKLGDHEQAAVTFDQVVKQYPEGNKVPDALYRQGIALVEIGKKTGQSDSYTPAARQIFERIVRDYSRSERVTEARRQLEILDQ